MLSVECFQLRKNRKLLFGQDCTDFFPDTVSSARSHARVIAGDVQGRERAKKLLARFHGHITRLLSETGTGEEKAEQG
jgi:hypothetical protein